MFTQSRLAIFFFILLASLSFSARVFAASSTLAITNTGDGDSVQISVTGDPNASVLFYYTKTGSGVSLNFLGNTNAQGSFITTVSATTYQVAPSTPVHVSINNHASPDVTWPAATAASGLSLTKTSLVLPLGQSASFTAFNNGSNLLYLASNSSPQVANVNISGNNISVSGNNFGSTTITICANGTTTACASAYVTVQNTNAIPLTFSQTNVAVASGTSITVNALGGTGSFVLVNNSNSSVIQASMLGAAVSLKALQTSGSSAITICSSDMSACGIINANIGGTNSTTLSFSQSNPIITVGQSTSVTISGSPANSTLSLYSNSNDTIVRAILSGSALNITGLVAGTSTVTVCSSIGSCAAVTITVNATLSTGGPITLSQNNLWIAVGQSYGIAITGGEAPYSTLSPSSNITATISGNILTITGLASGSATVSVCSGAGGCTTLSALVNGSGSTTTSPSTSTQTVTNISLSQNSVTVAGGATASVNITGNGGYSISSNSNPLVATATVSGSIATVTGLTIGNTTVSVCQNQGQCALLFISVTSNSTVVAAATWTSCANEKQPCTFAGSQTVRYGANGNYFYKTLSSGTICSNDTFGDPIDNVAKTCSYGGVIPAGYVAPVVATPITDSRGWTSCAAEKGSCSFTGSKSVRFGANGKYVTRTFSNGVICSNATFGDPIPNVAKTCSYQDIPDSLSSTVTVIAPTATLKHAVSFGMKGTDVTQLQKILTSNKLYSGKISGSYDIATMTAVKKFQKQKGIKQTGNVGPATLTALNK